MIMLLNLFMLIYIGGTYSQETLLLNRLELFNEVSICIITMHLLCFTEWLSIEIQANCGWSMVICTGLLIIADLVFVLKFGLKSISLIARRYYSKCRGKKRGNQVEPIE